MRMPQPLAIDVECYAGYRGEQTPRRFVLAGVRVEVADVLDCWLAPNHRYFKVQDAEGALCILRHDVESELWELTVVRHPS